MVWKKTVTGGALRGSIAGICGIGFLVSGPFTLSSLDLW